MGNGLSKLVLFLQTGLGRSVESNITEYESEVYRRRIRGRATGVIDSLGVFDMGKCL